MAKHISKNHIKNILLNSNRYRTLDLLIVMADMATQVLVDKTNKDYKFIVPSHNNAHALWDNINIKYPEFINTTTCRDCLNELISLGIVEYNIELNGYELIDMNEMLSKKGCGYINIRDFFFTKAFTTMKFSQKKILLFFIYQLDQKKVSNIFKNKFGVDIYQNLNRFIKSHKNDDLNIMTVLRTNDVYYVKSVLDNMLLTYPDLFSDKSEESRQYNYNKIKGKCNGDLVLLTYYLDLNPSIKDNTYNIDEEYNSLCQRYSLVHKNIEEVCSECNIELDKLTKLNLLRRLYKHASYVHRNVTNTVIKRLTDVSTSKTYGGIRNIAAFIQHLVNKYPLYSANVLPEYKELPF